MEVFKWMNDQLLRMDWLSGLVRLLVENVFGLDMASRVGGSVHFFIYDVIKIFILLSVLIFAISWIQSYFPPERTRAILGRMRGIKANIVGALLGTITPFCSCSSIPIFIGFTSAGLPTGVTFSFLISSPLVDLASVILLASIFDWPIALAYVGLGLVLAVVGGTLISSAKMEKHIEEFVLKTKILDLPPEQLSQRDRMNYAREQVADVVRRVWLFILTGVGVGALIHNWIPESMIAALLGKDNWWSVIVGVLAGLPMYADIFGTLPIAEALVNKGVGIGTVLAFMMAVTALSPPSLIMLKKVVRTPLLATFFGIVTVGIILIGYFFNAFAHLFI
ncbi:MAG TPA: hypothetical protein DHV59_16365 [Oxalobacteraceae bacterium]|nr:hypothetical protein [Oxalobacteraceae bacterium]